MRVANEAANPRLLLSGPFGTFYYRPEKARFEATCLWRDLTQLEYFLTRFNHNTCFQTDAWLVSRELTEAAGPWSDVGSPDVDGEYFSRVVINCDGVKFVPGARSYYRIGNPGSLAHRRSHQATLALFASKAKCIQYLLTLENSPRTREACLRLLQDWMFHACEYDDIVGEAHRLAAQLGGSLGHPRMRWKYRPIEWVFGYETAAKATRTLRGIRAQVECEIDRLFYAFSKATAPRN
jgi:hypothetical protein